jgi:hypothetical protein
VCSLVGVNGHGRTVANGVYFIELRTESEAAKKKVVLVR